MLQGPQYGPYKTNNPSCVKHSKEFLIVLGGHIISINVPLRKEEGYILIPHHQRILLIGIMSFPLLGSKHKNPPFLKPHDLHLSRFMIAFTSCFTIGKVHKWGTFLECEAKLDYCLVLGPLFWQRSPALDLSPPQKFQFIFTDKHHCHRVIIYPGAY